jgi:hypothetical protein
MLRTGRLAATQLNSKTCDQTSGARVEGIRPPAPCLFLDAFLSHRARMCNAMAIANQFK